MPLLNVVSSMIYYTDARAVYSYSNSTHRGVPITQYDTSYWFFKICYADFYWLNRSINIHSFITNSRGLQVCDKSDSLCTKEVSRLEHLPL